MDKSNVYKYTTVALGSALLTLGVSWMTFGSNVSKVLAVQGEVNHTIAAAVADNAKTIASVEEALHLYREEQVRHVARTEDRNVRND